MTSPGMARVSNDLKPQRSSDDRIGNGMDMVRECLNYGRMRGIGQWRNSGKGTYLWDELDDNGNVIGGNNKKGH